MKEQVNRTKQSQLTKQVPEEWEQAVHFTTDMVSVHDSNFTIVKANRAFAQAVGLAEDKLLGKKCYQVVHGTDKPPAHCPHKQALTSKTPVGEVFFEPCLGAYLVVSVTPLKNSKGKIVRSIHVARDITDVKKAEEALQKAHDELEETVRVRTGELTRANEQLRVEIEERKQTESALRMSEASLLVSRNELGKLAEKLILREEEEHRLIAIEVGSDFAKRLESILKDAGKLGKEIVRSEPKLAAKMRHLERGLAELSSDVQGLSERLHPSVLEEKDFVRAMQEECARFSRQRGINVQFVVENVSGEVPGYVVFSLYRVLQESLSNVAMHARTKKALVSLIGNNAVLRLSIKDRGIGFDPASVQAKKGLGIGGIEERARLTGGKCTIDSAPGKGTYVSVEVPTAYPEGMVASFGLPKLTQRQIDVLRLLAQGHVAKQIAVALNISAKTVEFHKYHIMKILGVKTVADLIRFAVKHHLVTV